MRIFAQDRAFYREVRVDLGEHPEAARRLELLQRVEQARGRTGAGASEWTTWP